jgi:hypothetical protein
MSVEQLCVALRQVKHKKRTVGDLSWQLSRLIADSELDFLTLEKLRDSLVMLISEGLLWRKELPHIMSDRPQLSGALAATCVRGLDKDQCNRWLYASVLALRLYDQEYSDDEPVKSLRELLSNLDSRENARLFWEEGALLQSLQPDKDPWKRFAEIAIQDGAIQLRPDRDLPWIYDELADTRHNKGDSLLYQALAIKRCGVLNDIDNRAGKILADDFEVLL